MGQRAKQLNRTGPLREVQPCHSCPIRMLYRSLVYGCIYTLAESKRFLNLQNTSTKQSCFGIFWLSFLSNANFLWRRAVQMVLVTFAQSETRGSLLRSNPQPQGRSRLAVELTVGIT